MKVLLSCDNIQLAYGDNVVVDVPQLSIESGSFIGLIGPNGAGKTTLMRSMAGQFAPRKGKVYFLNENIYHHNKAYKEQIGFVFENPFFYAHMTALEFLEFVARIYNVNKDSLNGKMEDILRKVGLFNERNKMTSFLSLGMRKKLAIAAAMIHKPRLLFLDEALNGIDIESLFAIKSMLKDYVDGGGSILLSTHVLEVVERLCDRYVLLKQGRIVTDFTENTLQHQGIPLETHVLSFLGTKNSG